MEIGTCLLPSLLTSPPPAAGAHPDLVGSFLLFVHDIVRIFPGLSNDVMRRTKHRPVRVGELPPQAGAMSGDREEIGMEIGRNFGKKIGRKFGKEIGRRSGGDREEIGMEIGRNFGKKIGRKFGKEIGRKFGKEIGRRSGWKFGSNFGKVIGMETLDGDREEIGRRSGGGSEGDRYMSSSLSPYLTRPGRNISLIRP